MIGYEKYKLTHSLGFEKIPAEWDLKKVKYLFHIGRGRVISQEELMDNGLYPVFSSQTQNNGCLGYINTFDFDCDQLTWTTDGANAGTVFIRSGKHNCTNVCGTLQPITDQTNLKFSHYALQYATQFHKRPDTNGAKIMNNEMAEISFALPAECEQFKIIEYLDHETAKIDNLIAKQEKLIQLLKEKRQAVISHAVTKGLNPNVAMKDSGVEWLGQVPEHWQTPCTKYLLEIPITDGPHETPQFVDEGIPFISAEAIHKGKINFDKKRGYIKPELNDIYSKKYSPKLEDIYMVKSGATTGKVAMVETEEKFNIWSPLAVFRCNKIKILPKFLLAVFNSNHFYDALVLNWSYGTQQNIGMGVLSNIEIPCPPINEQQEIIQHIDNELKVFKNLENKANHAIQLMQERRTALISAAVTGKIDVRHWQNPNKNNNKSTEIRV